MDTPELVKYRDENMLCWSCGRQGVLPKFMGSSLCEDHKKVYLKLGWGGLQILREGVINGKENNKK